MNYSDIVQTILSFSPLVLLIAKDTYIANMTKKNSVKKNYKIYKDGLSDKTLIAAFMEKRSLKEILYFRYLLGENYPNELREIFKKFVNYVEPEILDNCLLNLRDVKIYNKPNIKDVIYNYAINNRKAYYNIYDNEITLISKANYVLSHEFLHMASTAYWNRSLCGFSSINYDNDNNFIGNFGEGLNEGYTELLNSRIFYDSKRPKSYTLNTNIVKLIECFFDDYKEMECAYFKNNISAVYKAFCKYGTRDEFFYIINALDNFAQTTSPINIVDSIKVKFTLYEIIKRSNDKNKIDKFEKVLHEDPLFKLGLKTQFKLCNIESFEKQYSKQK